MRRVPHGGQPASVTAWPRAIEASRKESRHGGVRRLPVIDSNDPASLATFWCALLGVDVDTSIGEGEFLVLSPTAGDLTVGFQRVADPEGNEFDIDLVPADV